MSFNTSRILGVGGRRSLAVARELPHWVAILLGILLAWLVVRMFWLLVAGPSWQTLSLSPSLASGQSVSEPSVAQSPDALWSLLFRVSGAEDPAEFNSLPLDQSALTLVGVVLNPNTQAGFALIRGIGGQDQVFRLNDRLPDGRELVEIERDRVVLSSAGRREVLVLLDRDPELESESLRQISASASGDQGESEFSVALSPGIGIASLGRLLHSMGSSTTNEVLGGVQMMSVRTGGYRLRPSPEATWFSAVGLQIGDVLVRVNGQPVDSVVQSSTELEALVGGVLQGERVTLTVERNGQELTLQPDLESLRDALNNRM